MEIDWKLTYTSNFLMDTYQTHEFLKRGYHEANPLFSFIKKDSDWELPVIVSHLCLSEYLRKNRRDDILTALALWHMSAVEGNRQRTGIGGPIIWFKIKV